MSQTRKYYVLLPSRTFFFGQELSGRHSSRVVSRLSSSLPSYLLAARHGATYVQYYQFHHEYSVGSGFWKQTANLGALGGKSPAAFQGRAPHIRVISNNLKKIQKRATKLIINLKKMPHKDRLMHLNLPTLKYRRLREDMVEVFNMTHNMYHSEESPNLRYYTNLN